MSLEIAARWYWKDEWDFDSVPPAESAYMLARAILICAKGDGELADAERAWVIGWAAMQTVPDDKLGTLESYEANDDLAATVGADPILDEFARRVTAYFAIRACQADGVLAEGEKATIEEMAAQAGISSELVQQLFALVEAEDRLRTLRRLLLLPEAPPF